jgi:BASS family bile acid:Na+ symporter
VLALMAVLSVAAIVIVPLALEILELASGRPLAITPVAVARIVTISTLLPLAAGMLVHAIRPPLAASIERPVTLVGSILLPVAALALIVTAAPAIWALVGDGTVFAIVLFVVTGLVVGHALGGPEPDHSLGLALSTAYRHPAMAVSIAASNFPGERFGAAILLYLIVGLIVGLPYVFWQRRQKQRRTIERS